MDRFSDRSSILLISTIPQTTYLRESAYLRGFLYIMILLKLKKSEKPEMLLKIFDTKYDTKTAE